MRAAVAAMRRICREIRVSESVDGTGGELASLGEIFELMRYQELEEDERRYFEPAGTAGGGRTS
jgi:phosphoenolpyruvate phosphomutase